LGKTRDLLIDDGASGLRGDIARSKSRAAGGEDGITIITPSPGQKRAPYAVRIVRQNLDCVNQPSSLLKQLANCRTGTVLPPAGRCGITQDENLGAKRHKKLSADSFQPTAFSYQLSRIESRAVLEKQSERDSSPATAGSE
jgi:hypothetical protein